MKKEVKLYVCDRCGAQETFGFVRRESLSGGWENFNRYEPAVGWGRADDKDLCPECAKSLERTVERFMRAVAKSDK